MGEVLEDDYKLRFRIVNADPSDFIEAFSRLPRPADQHAFYRYPVIVRLASNVRTCYYLALAFFVLAIVITFMIAI